MKIIVALLMFVVISIANSQLLYKEKEFRKVDYKDIESTISDKNSKFYYPELMKRLNTYDTTLTEDDFFYLYYGFTCQPEYSPYGTSAYFDEYKKFASYEDGHGINDSILKYSELTLSDKPFSIMQYSMISYINSLMGNKEKSLKAAYISNKLIDAILSTGDGLTEENAIHVIYTSTEYDLIKVFGFKFESQALTEHLNDAMMLEDNKAGVKQLYFRVTRLFEINRKKSKK